jgi:hypothetical protein
VIGADLDAIAEILEEPGLLVDTDVAAPVGEERRRGHHQH